MRFVEEEDQHRLVDIASLRQLMEQFSQQPHHKGREQRRAVLKIGQREDADDPFAVGCLPEEIRDVELRLAEEQAGALLLQFDEFPVQHAQGRLRHAAIARQLLGIEALKIAHHGLQIGQVENRQVLIVAELEEQRQHTLLRIIEVEHLREQERTE